MFRGLRKWLRRLKNPKKTFQALKRLGKQKLKKIPGVKQVNNFMKNKKPLASIKSNIDNVAKSLSNRKDDLFRRGDDAFKSAKAGVSRFGDNALRMGRGFGDDAMRMGGKAATWFKNSPIAKRMALASTKYGGRMVPVAGTAFSAVDAADRVSRGDTFGAWLAGLGGASGLAATVSSPAALTGVGAVAPAALETGSIIADTSLFAYDIFNAITGREFNKAPKTKLSRGGVIGGAGGVPAMIGEAGPEMLIRDGQTAETATSSVNPLQSLAPIIVALREVTKRAGTWADPGKHGQTNY